MFKLFQLLSHAWFYVCVNQIFESSDNKQTEQTQLSVTFTAWKTGNTSSGKIKKQNKPDCFNEHRWSKYYIIIIQEPLI